MISESQQSNGFNHSDKPCDTKFYVNNEANSEESDSTTSTKELKCFCREFSFNKMNHGHPSVALMQNGAPKKLDSSSSLTTNGSSFVRTPSGNFLPSDPNLEYKPLDKILLKRIDSKVPFYSLEFFPARTAGGVTNLLERIERMGQGAPLFVDITWHPSSNPGSPEKPTSSSSIAEACLNYCGLETVLHMTCANDSPEACLQNLKTAKRLGLRNILALRGDVDDEGVYRAKPETDLKYAGQFVQMIKRHFGDYFVIIVAGYATGHPDAVSYDEDLRHLKEKVDAGAAFIITQLFFHETDYFTFVADCRRIGITVPIIPGVLPIQSYDSLRHIQKLSKLNVPSIIFQEVESVKKNDEAVRKYGVDLAVKMCRKLLQSGLAPGIHFYTLNREVATIEILQQLGLWKDPCPRSLPWKPNRSHPKRCRESVRPIFWASCPKSYLYRTKDWDDFPNGRWGNSSSPAFGDLKDYYLFCLKKTLPRDQLLCMWGGAELGDEAQVWAVFEAFITGEKNAQGVVVNRLPWSEEPIAQETSLVRPELLWCNRNGILTINSQPNINGAQSVDPIVGWGNPGGYVYQKAYLEFFISQRHLNALKIVLAGHPMVNFHIINHDGSIDFTNSEDNSPIAVTWGVFSGCEVLQPTVVDPISFHVWKSEAFETWLNQWATLYDSDSPGRATLQQIHDSYCLVTLVDNDYPQPCILWALLNEMLEKTEKIKNQGLSENEAKILQEFDQLAKCTVQNGTSKK